LLKFFKEVVFLPEVGSLILEKLGITIPGFRYPPGGCFFTSELITSLLFEIPAEDYITTIDILFCHFLSCSPMAARGSAL